MNPQNIRKPLDAAKAREQYMNNLKLDTANINKNYNANKLFTQTGQVAEIPDTRSTTDKLADINKLRAEVGVSLRAIADPGNASQISQNLTVPQLQFVSQRLPSIIADLGPKHKHGVLPAEFYPYVTAMMVKFQRTEGVNFGVQQSTGDDILASTNLIRANMMNDDDLRRLREALNRFNGLFRRNYNEFQQHPDVQELGPIVEELAHGLGVAQAHYQAGQNIMLHINDINPEVRIDVEENLAEGGIPYEDGQDLINEIDQFLSGDMNLGAMVPILTGFITSNSAALSDNDWFDQFINDLDNTTAANDTPIITALDPLSPEGLVPILAPLNSTIHEGNTDVAQGIKRFEGIIAPESLQNYTQYIYGLSPAGKIDFLIKSHIAQHLQFKNGKAFDLSKNQLNYDNQNNEFYVGKTNLEFLINEYISDVRAAGGKAPRPRQKPIVPNLHDFFPVTASTSKWAAEAGKINSLETYSAASPEAKRDFMNMTPSILENIGISNTDGMSNDQINGDYVKEYISDYFNQQKPSGKGLRKSIKGKGLKTTDEFANRVEYEGQGIPKSKLYVPFGRYVINHHRLHDNIVMLRTPRGGSILNHKAVKVSSKMGNILKNIVGGAIPHIDTISGLSEEERRHLHKIVSDCRINIPTVSSPDKSIEDQEMNRFQICLGQIQAGNDSPVLIKELKKYLISFSNSGRLPKAQTYNILLDLAALNN